MHDQDNQRPTGCGDCGAFPTTAGHRCPSTTAPPVGLEQLVDDIEARVRSEVPHADRDHSEQPAIHTLLPMTPGDGSSYIECPKCQGSLIVPSAPGTRYTLIHETDGSHTFEPTAIDAEPGTSRPVSARESGRATEAQVEAAWDARSKHEFVISGRCMCSDDLMTGGFWRHQARAVADAVVAAGENADEVTRLRAEVEAWESDHARLGREVHDLYESGMRSTIARAEAAEAEVARWQAEHDEVAGRLSALLCELTGGRLSKTTYDVRTMVQEIDSAYDEAQQEDRAERERLAARLAQVDAYRKDKARLLGACIDPEVRDWLQAIVKDLSAILDAEGNEGSDR